MRGSSPRMATLAVTLPSPVASILPQTGPRRKRCFHATHRDQSALASGCGSGASAKTNESRWGDVGMKTVRATCAHDCPCMCSLLVEVDGDRIVKISGDPEQPFTDG